MTKQRTHNNEQLSTTEQTYYQCLDLGSGYKGS